MLVLGPRVHLDLLSHLVVGILRSVVVLNPSFGFTTLPALSQSLLTDTVLPELQARGLTVHLPFAQRLARFSAPLGPSGLRRNFRLRPSLEGLPNLPQLLALILHGISQVLDLTDPVDTRIALDGLRSTRLLFLIRAVWLFGRISVSFAM